MFFESGDFSFKEEAKTIVIAEVGVNHNGDLLIAKNLVDAIARAKAHIVKFQAFNAEKEISRYAAKAPYQMETTSSEGSQLDLCKALQMSKADLLAMKDYCFSLGLPFLCTAFDFDSVDLLVDDLKVNTIKIPSGEITNLPLLQYIGAKEKDVVLSTGASTLTEVGIAIEVLKKAGCGEMLLLHCVTSYPAPIQQVNLRAMEVMKNAFGLPVGFSDHTIGIHAAMAATALGAVAIEKHVTLDRNMEGPDHWSSIEPAELAALVEGVEMVNSVIGKPVKEPAPCELQNLPLIRKSIVASRDLERGTRISREMLEIKRPQGGIAPSDIDNIIGLTLTRPVKEDKFITWQDFA